MSDNATQPPSGRDIWELDQALSELEAAAANFAARGLKDGTTRQLYKSSIEAMRAELTVAVQSGATTAQEGAKLANAMRNEIMEAIRVQSSDMGRAFAERMKQSGMTLEKALQKYARELFQSDFTLLNKVSQERVYLVLIEKSGTPSQAIMKNAATWGRVGRGCLFLTLAISVYSVASAQDKKQALGREGATVGGGILGGAAGGAAAGLVCGPGAPVCVTLGVFVGGALGALGADYSFDLAWNWKVAK